MEKWIGVEPLADRHVLDGFTCGNDEMDGWLHDQARRATKAGSASVTVCTHPAHGVVAFFALASHEVTGADVRRQDNGGLSKIPATLLARMGLHERLRNRGLGADLIAEALTVAVRSAQGVASRLVVVDAKNERLADLYETWAFRRTVTNPLRLYMKMATAAEVVKAYSS